MGLFEFIKSRLFGYFPGQIISDTGMVLCNQAMFLLGRTLMLVARTGGAVSFTHMNEMVKIQFLFSRDIMRGRMSESEFREILEKMCGEIDAMDNTEFELHSTDRMNEVDV